MPTNGYLLLVTLVVVTVAGCDAAGRSGNAMTPPRPVSVMVLRQSDPARLDRVAASVASWKTESIGLEVAGRLQFVIEPETEVLNRTYDASGKLLRESTVLARLDTTRYDLEVKSVAADIEANRQQGESLKIEIDQVFPAQTKAAEAERDLAQTEVERNQSLVAQKAAPQRALDLSHSKLESSIASVTQVVAEREAKRAELASLEAKREQLEQSLAEAKRDVADCTLYSPFAGQTAEVHVIPGGFVERGESVVTVQMMDPIMLEFEVSRDTLRRLHFRDALPVTIAQADGTALDRFATVYMTDPAADPETRTFTVTLLIRNEMVAPDVPDELRGKPTVETNTIWPVMGRLIDDANVRFVDALSFQEDADGTFLWKVTNRRRRTLAADATPQLQVSKVRVKRGERRVDFLGLFTFQEVSIAEGEDFDLDTDMVTGKVTYPKGLDSATWEGGVVLFRRQRWLLRPGDLVGVDISGRPTVPGFYVPLDTILDKSGKNYVFVVEDTGEGSRVRQIEVRVGEAVGTRRRIESLEEGVLQDGKTRIVSGGALFLADGETVNVTKEVEVAQ